MDDSTKCGILVINGIVISPIIAMLMTGFNKYPEWGLVIIILCFMLMVCA